MEAALGLDLSSLLSQLSTTQQTRSSAKLSERNVVELINKLRQLGIIAEGELLHTLSGKEYLTVDYLRVEIKNALFQAGGRLSLVELPTIVGVDLFHCERQVANIVTESNGAIVEVQGELITAQYFDTIAAEINDQLQEAGQLSIGELAAQYGLATEMILSIVSARLDTSITGRLESGLLYTQSYLRAIKAQLRGALRGTASPVLVASLLREATAEGPGGGAAGGGALAAALAGTGGGGVIATLVEELVQDGAVRGALKGGGTSWTPAVYGEVQQEAVNNFYSQNGWIAYDTVRRLGISNERSYLRTTFPDGLPLESAFLAPSLLAGLEAAVEEVATQGLQGSTGGGPGALGPGTGTGSGAGAGGGGVISGGWVDVGPLLPTVLNEADVAALLARLPSLRDQERRPLRERRAHVIGGTWVLGAALVAALQQRADAEARSLAQKALAERKASGAAAGASAGGGGGGVAAGAGGSGGKKKAAAADDDDDDWSMGQGKKGGKGKKGASAKSGSKQGGAAGGGGGSGSRAASSGGVTLSWLAAQLPGWCPDLEWEEGGGGGGGAEDHKAVAVAKLLAAGAEVAYAEALQAAFTAGAEERRRVKDTLAKQYEESYGRLLLYGAGADLYADKEDTYTALTRHALRTAGAECVDLLHRWARAEYQHDAAEGAGHQPLASGAGAAAGGGNAGGALSAAEVKQVLRAVPADVAEGLTAAAGVPAAASVKAAEELLDKAAVAVGVRAKKLDKKGEKAALAALRERLMAALAAETDPPAALALMVPLAHIRITGKVVTLPGKSLKEVLSRLQQQAEPGSELAAVTELVGLHEGVVEYLRAQSAASGTTPETSALLERLCALLPGLKSALGLQVTRGADATVP